MELMTVEDLNQLLKQDKILIKSQEIKDILGQLQACHESRDWSNRCLQIVDLAKKVRSYQAKNVKKKWPVEMLDNLCGHLREKMTEIQVDVPTDLHFVWIGSPIPDVVKDYINVWAQVNPRHKINVWYDKNLVCLKQFSDALKKKAMESDPTRGKEWANEVFRLRQLFTRLVLQRSPYFADLTGVMNTFSEENNLGEVFQEVPVWPDLPKNGQICLQELNDTGVLAHELRPIYMMEAIQTQNFAALSDIARVLVLWNFGGVYLDVDMMPQICPELTESFCKEDDKMQRRLLQAIMTLTGTIPDYRTTEFESCEKRDEIRAAVAGRSLQELMLPLDSEKCKCNPMAFRVYLNTGGVINQMVMAPARSMMIQMLIEQMKQNYGIMDEYFKKPPLLSGSLLDNTGQRADIVKEYCCDADKRDNRVAQMLIRTCDYYMTGLLKEHNTTICLTGPALYEGTIHDVAQLESGKCTFLCSHKNEIAQCTQYLIQKEMLSVYTEEELRSSWLVRD